MRLRHIGMAFFWACSMLTFRSSILLSGNANTPELSTVVVIVSFVGNMTTMLAIAAWVENDPERIDSLRSWPFVISIIVGLFLVAGAGYAGEIALLPLLLSGSVLTGIGYGFFWGSWADCYGRMHPSRTSFYLPVAFLVTAALFLTISFAAENWGIPAIALMVPLPLISFLCLQKCRAEKPDGRAVVTEGSKRSLAAISSLLGLIVASLVLSCLFGFMWQLTVFTTGSVAEAHFLPLIANLAVALPLVGIVLYAHTRIDLDVAYRVVVPVIVVLFAVLPFLWESNPVVLNVIMSASYGVFDVIIWSLVVACAYDFAVSGYIVGGIVRSLSILLRLVGMGIGYVVTLVPETPSTLIIGVSLGALYVLVMLGLFNLLRRKRKKGSDDFLGESAFDALAGGVAYSETGRTQPAPFDTTPNKVDPPLPGSETADSLSDTPSLDPEDNTSQTLFAAISEDYGLTRRETEVLPFLARGRSAKVIAEALFVSESTVRTHIRRILEKTDLHSKQELIDLIERYD